MDGPLAFPADGQDQHLACSNVLRPAVRIVQRDPAMNDVANLRVRLAIGRKPPGRALPDTCLSQTVRRFPQGLCGLELVSLNGCELWLRRAKIHIGQVGEGLKKDHVFFQCKIVGWPRCMIAEPPAGKFICRHKRIATP